MSSSLIVTHDMTESVASLQRMSSDKARDLLTCIDTSKQIPINLNTEFNHVNQYAFEVQSMIINMFVVVFMIKVSHYLCIQSNPEIYIPDNIVAIAKETILCASKTVRGLPRLIQVELIPMETQATDINTIHKMPGNCCPIFLNND